jgi:hypothetical protein
MCWQGGIMNGNTDQFQKDLRANLSKVVTACDHFITIVNEMMSGTERELREQLMEIDKAVEQNRARIGHTDDRDHLFRSIATSVARVLTAPLDDGGDVSLLMAGQAR